MNDIIGATELIRKDMNGLSCLFTKEGQFRYVEWRGALIDKNDLVFLQSFFKGVDFDEESKTAERNVIEHEFVENLKHILDSIIERDSK